MGVMHSLAPVTEQPPLIFTPHPVTLDGQKYIPAPLDEGETLANFLARVIGPRTQEYEVKIGGVVVPEELWHRVRPKNGHVIEVRGKVGKQALYIVAMIALIYFTGGAGATAGGIFGSATGAGTFYGMSAGIGASLAAAGTFMVGAMIINKVLGPKPPGASSQPDRESVYSIGGARNALRPHEPLGLLFGSTRIAPDILSLPYSFYEGNDQFLAMVLTPGINVDRFDDLYLGDTKLSEYEGVQVWTSGFPGMPEQDIPLYSNVDTVAGGELDKDSTWVTRTTSTDTVRVMVNIEWMLGDVTSEGKPYTNRETVQVDYRPVGGSSWTTLMTRMFAGSKYEVRRSTLAANVARGHYDIRVRRLGNAWEEKNGKASFNFTTLSSVQADDTDYRGIPRIGIKIKATGQLNGTPDQIRAVFHQKAMPIWNGTSWTTATDRATGLSNPGALMLQYARGYYDLDGNLIAGMGLPDTMIDIPALQAFMLHCAANGYTYDHWLQSPRSHREAMDSIALAGFGQYTRAGGRVSVAWAADGQPLTGVVNMATMKRGSFDVDYTLVNAADGIEYTYFDRDTWQSATIRVPAPGVTVMLNPARLTGEGVTTEEHAAEMARYHLAQHLYQFKSIGYSTDLEHMTYRRLSVLALQHDLTQWGRGGRLVAAESVAGVVTVQLDEPVEPPSSGSAYIGLRVPGERVCRVFEVAPFAEATDTVTLADPWPGDAAFPGTTGNPAHDTIWIYDFKATPGYRVRVTSIEPESGLKGARISCVPESPEFWTYVKTGHYEPPVTPPANIDFPVASNLVISERTVVQGDTEFTELVATFDVSGYASHCVVYAAQLPDGELEEVAQTSTRTAAWRIEEAGEYAVVVRPFNAEGVAGTSVSGSYITERADTPPPVFDIFEVAELSGGVRRYFWGYLADTTQAANLAGAEIRYTAGNVASPIWGDMTPLGEGFHTAAFEAVLPAAGVWTFSIRARNTAGILSTEAKTIVRTLTGNLGEVLDDLYNDLTGEINDLSDRVDTIAAEVSDIVGADEWSAAETYAIGDLVKRLGKMYRALTANTNKPPESNPSDWQLLGDYSSLGEAVAAALSISNQNTTDIAAESSRLDALYARMPSGSGELATSAMVATEATARSDGDTANANLINAVRASVDEVFTSSVGWQFIANHNGFTATNASLSSFPATSNFGATAIASNTADPNFLSPTISVSGRTSPIVRAMVRRRTSSTWEGQLYWQTPGHGFNTTYRVAGNVTPEVGVWTVVEWDLTANTDWRASEITRLRFDFASQTAATVDVRWIVVGDKGPGRAASASQEFSAEVDGIDNRLRAKHTVALDVDGYVSGTVSENDGTTSSFSVLADKFAIVAPGGGARTEYSDGNWRIYDANDVLRVRLGVW